MKTAATAHAQTCQNISGYDLSNIYEETEIKHVSRPPEARSKIFATATAHAQTCQNMSGYDLSNIYEETEIKHVSRPPEAYTTFCLQTLPPCAIEVKHYAYKTFTNDA